MKLFVWMTNVSCGCLGEWGAFLHSSSSFAHQWLSFILLYSHSEYGSGDGSTAVTLSIFQHSPTCVFFLIIFTLHSCLLKQKKLIAAIKGHTSNFESYLVVCMIIQFNIHVVVHYDIGLHVIFNCFWYIYWLCQLHDLQKQKLFK